MDFWFDCTLPILNITSRPRYILLYLYTCFYDSRSFKSRSYHNRVSRFSILSGRDYGFKFQTFCRRLLALIIFEWPFYESLPFKGRWHFECDYDFPSVPVPIVIEPNTVHACTFFMPNRFYRYKPILIFTGECKKNVLAKIITIFKTDFVS